MRKTSRAQALFALLAVVSALSVLLPYRQPHMTPLEERSFGKEARLPDGVFRIRVVLGSGAFYWGTASFVDAKYHLYLTASHVLVGVSTSAIQTGRGDIPITEAWLEPYSDLAVVEAKVPPGVRPMPIATTPVHTGQVVYALGYHPVGRMSPGYPRRLYGFRRRFTVVEAETDHCIDDGTCQVRDFVRWRVSVGFPLTLNAMPILYPYSIFATHERGDGSAAGLVGGMSGGPLVDEQGVIVGVNARYIENDPDGNRGMFAPAHRVQDLLARARATIDARKTK